MLDNKVWLYRIFWCLYNRVWQGSVKPFYSGYIGRKWPHNQSCWDLWEVISQVEVIMFWIIYCDTYDSSYKEQTSAGATQLPAGGRRRQLLCPDGDTPKVPSCQLEVGKLAHPVLSCTLTAGHRLRYSLQWEHLPSVTVRVCLTESFPCLDKSAKITGKSPCTKLGNFRVAWSRAHVFQVQQGPSKAAWAIKSSFKSGQQVLWAHKNTKIFVAQIFYRLAC